MKKCNAYNMNKARSRIDIILLLFVVLILGAVGCGENDIMLETINGDEDGQADYVSMGTEEGQMDKGIEETSLSHDMIVIYVCGAVKSEGVYELEAGCRINDAIEAAGGFSEEACTTSVNLSAKIEDEAMVYIPSKEEANAGGVVVGQQQDARININTASIEELMTLKGIGEAKAKAIVSYREENGLFESAEDIMKVSGIGQGYFNKIKEDIRVK